MISVFKILEAGKNGELDDGIPSMLPLNTRSQRRQDRKLFIEHSKKDIRKYNFNMRVRKVWNSLPNYVVNAKDVINFEKALDNFWKDQPLLYDDFKAEIVINEKKIKS